jgi:hypothetical protein
LPPIKNAETDGRNEEEVTARCTLVKKYWPARMFATNAIISYEV